MPLRPAGYRASAWAAGLLALANPATASAQHGITLANGDHLTGTLVRVAGGTWYVRYGSAELKISSAHVRGFWTDQPLGVRLSDGLVAAGTFVTDSAGLVFRLADGRTRRIAPGEILAVGPPDHLTLLRPTPTTIFRPFFRFWDAAASLGFSNKTGNSRSQGLTLSAELNRRAPRDRLSLKIGLARESKRGQADTLELAVAKYYAQLRIDLSFTPRFFAFTQMRQERDRFQDLDLRSNYVSGLGFQILNRPATDFRASASGGVRYENYASGGSTTAGVLSAGLALLQKLGPATLGWEASYVPAVEDFKDYQLRSDASFLFAIYKGLGFRMGILNEYDNRPQPGIQKHDMLITTAFTYAVGR